jgi:D-glycero-alpha-D-manno-heptose-7-phosphate kinase
LSAIEAGAIGGKILGAGGGGFLLIFAKPENHQKIKDKLKDLVYVPFAFETDGSKVVLYQPNGL